MDDRVAGSGAERSEVDDRAGASSHITLDPVPASAGEARRWVVDQLRASPEELRRTAALLVSELVANAVVHAGTAVSVSVSRGRPGGRVCVEVADGSAHVPAPGAHEVERVGGRGLQVVAALADEWGTKLVETGKVVWFTLVAETAEGTPVHTAEGKADDVDPPLLPPDTPHGRLS